MCVGVGVSGRESPDARGRLSRPGWVWWTVTKGTAPRSGTLFSILCFLASRQATATAHACPLGSRAGGSSSDHSTATSPLPVQSLLPKHRPLAPQSLPGPYLLVVARPAIMPAPEDALQLHPIFVSAVEGAGDRRAYWLRSRARPSPSHHLAQSDGSPKLRGEGPVGRAPIRLRLRGGVCEV